MERWCWFSFKLFPPIKDIAKVQHYTWFIFPVSWQYLPSLTWSLIMWVRRNCLYFYFIFFFLNKYNIYRVRHQQCSIPSGCCYGSLCYSQSRLKIKSERKEKKKKMSHLSVKTKIFFRKIIVLMTTFGKVFQIQDMEMRGYFMTSLLFFKRQDCRFCST